MVRSESDGVGQPERPVRKAPAAHALDRETDDLRQRAIDIREQLAALRLGSHTDPRFRLAALNLMEDAEEARRRIELMAAERAARTERALRESEDRLGSLLNAMDEAFVIKEAITDDQGRVVDWRYVELNPAFTRVTGLKDPLNKTVRELIPDIEPVWIDRYSEVLRTGQSVRFQDRIASINRWLDVFASRVGGPESRRVALVFSDITERKLAAEALARSEERLRLMIENAREYAIFSTDLDRRITSWNSGAEAILGYTEEEIIGRSADIIFTDEDRAAGACAREAEVALKDGRSSDDRWHQRKDGTRFWASGAMMAMHGPNGEKIGLVKILRDETESKRAREALARSRAELEQSLRETERARQEAEAANRTKDQFLAALSHELRTPLTPVMMAAESLLRRKDLPPRVVEALEMICRNIQMETHFIDDLLDVTRIAHGKMELVRKPIDLHDAIQGGVEVSRPDFIAKAQELTIDLQAVNTRVNGDLARLQQVFWNLLKNASKFTPNKGTIRILSQNDGKDWIEVQVIDTGRGIDHDALEVIFEPFCQEQSEISRQFGGLGLGLAIAKATVAGHGGSIASFSEGHGKGSTFTVRLPVLNE